MTDKERLEKIKNIDLSWILYHLKTNTIFDADLLKEYWNWLIQQAERVEELEEFKASAEKLYKNYHISAKKSVAEKEKLKEQNQRYRKALEEIRDEESEPHLFNDRQRVYTMTGRIALEALEGEK